MNPSGVMDTLGTMIPEDKPCDKEPGVFYTDIVRAYGKVIQKIIRLVVKVLYEIWNFIVWTFVALVGFSVFLTPFIPGFIFMFCVATLLAVLWDSVTKPLIIKFINIYNGTASAWNRFTDSIRDIGINERFFGERIRIRLFGINLPKASVANANIPDFWTFVYDVLTPDVIKRKVLSKIFREKGYVPPPKKETCLTKI
jgi:hypothetical protein